MLRKSLCLLVLAAMTLHCASRLGALSFLYENRHSFAYSMGIIAEIPIAMCNSDYDFSKGLKVEASDLGQPLPIFAQAHEIILFVISEYRQAEPQKILLSEAEQPNRNDNYYLTRTHSIFHPPTFLA